MSSSAAVHFESPIKSSSSDAQFLHFNADCVNPSEGRSRRPRLAKLRKHHASQQVRSRGTTSTSTSTAAEDASCAGFTHFLSDKVTNSIHNNGVVSDSAIQNRHRDDVFVFGSGRGNWESVRDSQGSDEGKIGQFVFSPTHSYPETKNNGENVSETLSASGVFVFCAFRNNVGVGGKGVCKFEFGGSHSDPESSVNVEIPEPVGSVWDATRSEVPMSNLSDEMDKLNIKDPEGAADITRNSENSHASASAGSPPPSKESFTDFKPPAWDPSSFKDNLFSSLNKKVESTPKGRLKYMRQKLKPHSLKKKQAGSGHLSKENNVPQTPGSSGIHSPMDFSPYQETTANDQDQQLPAMGSKDSRQTDQRGSGAGASGVDFTSNTEKQKDGVFVFVHGVNDSKGKDFSFSASSTVAGAPPLKRQQKKKFRRRVGCNSFGISPSVNGKPVSSLQFSPHDTANLQSHSNVMDSSQTSDQLKEGNVESLDTIPAACDMWRLRGNQAHKDGDLSKAEDFYTRGINSVSSSERSECWVKPLLLCYSNRAATRMGLGKIRAALEDCMKASALDPAFLKVQMRAANCHLLLGELENAQQCFNKCMESVSIVCLDRRIIVEAAEGLHKAEEVVKCINNAAELLKERTSDAAVTALELVSKALSISLYSEKLLQMKAEALCLQQKYDAAIQLAEQSQHLAEKNFFLAKTAENCDCSLCDSYSSVKLWRWSLISKCYFHLGRLEASLNVLEKLQHVVTSTDKCGIDNMEDSLTLASTIQELLNHRRAGNENFKLGKYTEAIANYTAALSCHIKSRPFMAICFCNRAAAHQALGQIADAIADCSVAIALDGNYAKAISRRATLHEMVRDYEQATCDLKRHITVLESQSNESTKESRQAHQRLHSVEDQAKKGTPLDVYLILGIKSADTATDIKKAYHKAALRHHPDKAGQLLARSDGGDEGRVWKEISEEVYKDADKLFKMIGEAYAVLSDPAKRSEYDLEEEIRKAAKLSNRGGTNRRSSDAYGCGRPCDGYNSHSDRTSSRRYGRDHWKHSYPRW
ncbi:hypothetical protein VNO78_17067 [Psophocarpus tetragonolobus]|uniref:J domain-containing protein n=1 Tax=Psophocarpus tetragonolobus TaxID=3891 RepID=A0AAN9SMD0_PSOTE